MTGPLLASLDPARLGAARDWLSALPVLVLVVAAFAAGVAVAMTAGAFRRLARSARDLHRAERNRRAEALVDLCREGRDAELAGRPDAARRAYEEALRRDPAHAEAAARLADLARARDDHAAALRYGLEALRAEERISTLLAVADDYRRLGRADDAAAAYERVVARDAQHRGGWRGLRDVAAGRERWAEAARAQDQLLRLAPPADRAVEETWRAGIEYEIGRAAAASGDAEAALSRFREALRLRPDFLPALLATGDVLSRSGETREAARVWERALAIAPAAPVLARIERFYRSEGRPARMIALYEEAAARHPDDLAIAFGLGRVYFELAMLDEAADHFEKLEVRAPDSVLPRAYLGAIFERHGRAREAFEEYRRALRFPESFEWPHRCSACHTVHPAWFDRCRRCGLWNTSRP